MIDFTNPSDKVSQYFSVREVLWLPQWGRMANESDGLNDDVKNSLINLCQQMDLVREFLNAPINVHVTFRPVAYNALPAVGGAKNSAHIYGMAMDFDASGMTCDEARKQILDNNKLEEWNMRMEKRPGSNWVHLDYHQVLPGGNRYFLP